MSCARTATLNKMSSMAMDEAAQWPKGPWENQQATSLAWLALAHSRGRVKSASSMRLPSHYPAGRRPSTSAETKPKVLQGRAPLRSRHIRTAMAPQPSGAGGGGPRCFDCRHQFQGPERLEQRNRISRQVREFFEGSR
jgi:hypothetical protein